jgi:hypothetical protein
MCIVEFCRNDCPILPDYIEVDRASGYTICDICFKEYYQHLTYSWDIV